MCLSALAVGRRQDEPHLAGVERWGVVCDWGEGQVEAEMKRCKVRGYRLKQQLRALRPTQPGVDRRAEGDDPGQTCWLVARCEGDG